MEKLIISCLSLGCFLVVIQGDIVCNLNHASCELTWTWTDVNCSDVSRFITNQMIEWKGFDGCGDGEKCGYTVSSSSSTKITGVHTSPVNYYRDDLTMKFSGSCTVQAKSSSETWYAVLDYGTNYCNLHNLVIGAGLDEFPGYKEETSDLICTQYSSANCDKY